MNKPATSQACNTHECTVVGCSANNGCNSRYAAVCGTSNDCNANYTIVWDGPPTSEVSCDSNTTTSSCGNSGIIKWGNYTNCTLPWVFNVGGYSYTIPSDWSSDAGSGGGGYQRRNQCVTRKVI